MIITIFSLSRRDKENVSMHKVTIAGVRGRQCSVFPGDSSSFKPRAAKTGILIGFTTAGREAGSGEWGEGGGMLTR